MSERSERAITLHEYREDYVSYSSHGVSKHKGLRIYRNYKLSRLSDLISVQHYSAHFKRTLCLRNHARRGCCFTHEWLSRCNQLGLSSQQRDIIPAYVRCLQKGVYRGPYKNSIQKIVYVSKDLQALRHIDKSFRAVIGFAPIFPVFPTGVLLIRRYIKRY